MTVVFISVKDVEHSRAKWIDTRYSLQNANDGKKRYEMDHVKGAVYWDLENDMSDLTHSSGRHPLPSKKDLTELVRNTGLTLDDQILIYDDGGSPFAARAWWILQYAGFKNAFIIVDSYEDIKKHGIPIEDRQSNSQRTTVTPIWDAEIYADREYVKQVVDKIENSALLDARAEVRYKGEYEPLDKIAGRIPGALNFDWEQLKDNGIFKLNQRLNDQLLQHISKDVPITVYCGSGVTAAPLYAALKHFNYSNVRLYVGSYSDWISVDDTRVEKG